MVNTAVILAAGLGSRLKERTTHQPKGFVEIDGLAIVERSIQQLLASGITQIMIGTGYLSEFYEQLSEKYPAITCIHNKDYRDSGSMYTLYQMKDVLTSDFLLLESDLLYDPTGLKCLLDDTAEDMILASGTTHSNDEVYIEYDHNHFLVNMSKQLAELKSADAELVGICKISIDTYKRMCQWSADVFAVHLKWDYEQALVAVSQHKPLLVYKLERYVWCEIDTEEHLIRAQNEIYPKLQQKPNDTLPIRRHILLNPGPATTTDTVKWAQVVPDICPRETEFGELMKWTAEQLTSLVAPINQYTTVLFGGSGTAAVEAVLSSVIGEGKLLIISNGAYGERMAEIVEAYGIDYEVFSSSPILPLVLDEIEQVLQRNQNVFTHVAVVHHETTSGLLNDIDRLGHICARYNVDLIVDAMSSYGAIPIDMKQSQISFLISSSNKNIQGMAGIGFVIANREKLQALQHHTPKNYYLNLYKQYAYFEKTGQMRFTPPVQTFYALKQAIIETQREGVEQRYARYTRSWETLIKGLDQLELEYLVPLEHHSKIITTIQEPAIAGYDFDHMHDYLYEYGITIYPGKIGQLSSFRIANIGDINHQDITYFLEKLKGYLDTIR
ncbi:2-aminoethylphosphonate--pyruvate transaminase [Paenibacillus sp. PK4536]|uniref:2-aminoethylphosphonate aminotransferase n=1 Tax=Paenibacillus sp. PK4536 TaxID=3024576 RepID=UPI00235983AF|nr:2-aminoethylphosphonate--pyruvate transaminase [Paenibacillus sp. PK4536]WIM39804.1 2-aminoethylphosphonate--pyruvate transaminase [Paenibacillus sp. PK4536]